MLTLDRVPFTIVKVAPPGFFGVTVGAAFDVAVPFQVGGVLGEFIVGLPD